MKWKIIKRANCHNSLEAESFRKFQNESERYYYKTKNFIKTYSKEKKIWYKPKKNFKDRCKKGEGKKVKFRYFVVERHFTVLNSQRNGKRITETFCNPRNSKITHQYDWEECRHQRETLTAFCSQWYYTKSFQA